MIYEEKITAKHRTRVPGESHEETKSWISHPSPESQNMCQSAQINNLSTISHNCFPTPPPSLPTSHSSLAVRPETERLSDGGNGHVNEAIHLPDPEEKETPLSGRLI